MFQFRGVRAAAVGVALVVLAPTPAAAAGSAPPVLAAIGAKTAEVGEELSFQVSGSDQDDWGGWSLREDAAIPHSTTVPHLTTHVSVNNTSSATFNTHDLPFTAKAGAVGRFATRNSVGDPFLRLVNASGRELFANDDGGGGVESLIEYTFAADGVYVLRAGAFSFNHASYAVDLSVEGHPVDGAGYPPTNAWWDLDTWYRLWYRAEGLPDGASFDGATRTFRWTPTATDVGDHLVTFVVSDHGPPHWNANPETDRETITISVRDPNEAPAGTDSTHVIAEDTQLTFTADDFGFSDPLDSPPDSFAAVHIATLPAAGSLNHDGAPATAGQAISTADIAAGKLVYTPAADESGTLYSSFDFQVQDDGGTADGGSDLDQTPNTVRIDVTPVNDAPQLERTLTDADVAEDAPFEMTIPPRTFTDVDEDVLALAAARSDGGALPEWLTFEAETGTFSGTPGNADVGTQTVVVTATDPSGESISDSFTLTVHNTNDAPVAVSDAYTTWHWTALTVAAPGVLANDSDIDVGDVLTVTLGQGAQHGSVSLQPDGSFTYEPRAGFVGNDEFTYLATDGAATVLGRVAIRVTLLPSDLLHLPFAVVGR